MRKIVTLALVLAMLCCVASACKKAPDPYEGYIINEEHTGGAPLAEANARTVTVSQSGEDTTIGVAFHSGSRMSGGSVEAPAENVPEYRIYVLQAPARLVIEFASLGFTDYERDGAPKGGCVLASFLHRMAGEEKVSLVFQLSGDAAYIVGEDAGTLTLQLKPLPAPEPAKKQDEEKEAIQVVADAYRDYCDGKLPNVSMTPTLDAQLDHVLLISPVFYSNIEAEYFIQAATRDNVNAVAEEWTVAPYEYGRLPEYDESTAYKAAYSEAVIRQNGAPVAAEVFIADGWYLTGLPRRMGEGALYGKRMTVSAMNETYECDMLYLMSGDGSSRQYLNREFETIESASFSPDGRRLAVLERAAEATNFYIFDVETEELVTDLTDVGFGDTVSAYTWNDLGSAIYAVSGSEGMLVHQYDFNVPAEGERHGIVEKNGADEGCIAYCAGSVYFLQSDMERGDLIYRVKCDGGVRKEFTYGSMFEISGDSAYMAINSASGVTVVDAQNTVKFRLYDMASGESRTITNDFGVQDFLWSEDCTRVYYFQNRVSGDDNESSADGTAAASAPAAQDDYPYTLWMYDVATGENREIADFPSTGVFASGQSGRLYFNYSDSATMGQKVRATYMIDVDALLSEGGAGQ